MKSQKKLLSLIIVVVMLICMIQVSLFATEKAIEESKTEFTDMPDNWAANALNKAVANGLLVGSGGKISPNEYLTRAQMAAVIVRAFNAQIKADLTEYTDVSTSAWYADSMAKAYQMGVIKGSNGKMFPTDSITRQEVFVIMARAFKLTPAKTANKAFKDLNEISDWAKEDVYAVVNTGYVQGSNGILNPKGLITRAQFAVVFDNFVKQYIKTAGEYSFVSEGNVMINTPGVTLKDLNVAGDLIIGDGVGDGNVILDNVKVAGRVVARGGGENSIIIKGASTISNLIVSKADGVIGVKVEGDAKVDFIYIADGSKISIEGKIENIEMHSRYSTVTATNTQIETANVYEQNIMLIINKASTIERINIESQATNAKVSVSGKVTNIDTQALNAEIFGSGIVEGVHVNSGANNAKIVTPNTRIYVGEDVKGVTGGGGKEIRAEKSATNNNTGTGILTYESIIGKNSVYFYSVDESIDGKLTRAKNSGDIKIKALVGSAPETEIVFSIDINGFSYAILHDKNGEYFISGIPEGKHEIYVSAYSFKNQYIDVKITKGKASEILVNFERQPHIGGIIKDSKGDLVKDASIVVKKDGLMKRTDTSSETGEFGFFIDSGIYNLSAFKPGYKVTIYEDANSELATSDNIEIILEKADQFYSISGKITDTKGNPIQDSFAYFENDDIYYWARTSNDGTFRLDGLPEGTYKVDANNFGYSQSSRVEITIPQESEKMIDFIISKTLYFNGVIKDSSGDVIPDVSVQLWQGNQLWWSSDTDETGKFQLQIKEGIYNLSAFKSGYNITIIKDLYIDSSGDTNINLEKTDLSNSVSGTITDTEGYPLADASIVIQTDSFRYWLTTSKDGSYSLEGIPDGDYSISASKSNYSGRTKWVTILPGNNLIVDIIIEERPSEK